MREPTAPPRWTRHLLYRAEHTRITWKLRLGLLALVIVTLWLSSGWWTSAIARSLVCEANGAPSEAILVENLESDYFAFERASVLRRAGFAARVLVPIATNARTSMPNEVAVGTVELMARVAHLGPIEIVPIQEVEPIALNAARDVLRFLERERIRSVLVVAPLFRSRRSALVYTATLGQAGLTVTCEPARGPQGVKTWTQTWHGIQNVAEQWLKLQYYRLYVLPFRAREPRFVGLPTSP